MQPERWTGEHWIEQGPKEYSEIRSHHARAEVINSAKKEFLSEMLKSGTEEIIELVSGKIDSLLESGGLSEEQAQAVGRIRDEFIAKIDSLLDQIFETEGRGSLGRGIRKLMHGIKEAFRELYHGLEEILTQDPENTEQQIEIIEPFPKTLPIPIDPNTQETTSTKAELSITIQIGELTDTNKTEGSIPIKDITGKSIGNAADETTKLDVESFLYDLTQAFKSGFRSMHRDMRAARIVVQMFGYHGRVGLKGYNRYMEALEKFLEIFKEKLAGLYEEQNTEEPSVNETAKTDERVDIAV